MHHLLVGLLLAAGRAVPAEEHPWDGETTTADSGFQSLSLGGLGDDCYFCSSLEGGEGGFRASSVLNMSLTVF